MENVPRRTFLKETAIMAIGGMLGGTVIRSCDSTRQDVEELMDKDILNAIERLKKNVVKIEGKAGHGTGFFLNPSVILTNKHVLADNEISSSGLQLPPMSLLPGLPPVSPEMRDPQYKVSLFHDDDRKPYKIFFAQRAILKDGTRAQHSDMGLLQAPVDLPCPVETLTWDVPRKGEKAMVLGNPVNLTGMSTFGRVTKEVVFDAGTENWQKTLFFMSDAAINPGNSGSPVFGIRKSGGKVETPLLGMVTFGYRGHDGLGGCIRSDFIAYHATTRWGVPMMDGSQIKRFEEEFPMLLQEAPKSMAEQTSSTKAIPLPQPLK